MIVINKKQILTGIFTFSLLVLVIIGLNKNNYNFENANSVPSISLPVSNKVVIIDAGHGKPDERCAK